MQALQYSFKEGLEDEPLMLELGRACVEQGLAHMAQSVLARALLTRDTVQVCPSQSSGFSDAAQRLPSDTCPQTAYACSAIQHLETLHTP
jgi:hypothetical protein